MDWTRLIAENLPRLARGASFLVASRMAETPTQPVYPVEEFMKKRVDVLDQFRRDKEQEAKEMSEAFQRRAAAPPPPPPEPQRIQPPASGKICPFCLLEEKAGVVKNHMEFVSSECSPAGMGEATGGMIPKAKTQVGEVVMLAEAIGRLGGPTAVLASSVASLGAQLEPKLEWIGTCEEAEVAVEIATKMWRTAAKAAQVSFAQEEGGVSR